MKNRHLSRLEHIGLYVILLVKTGHWKQVLAGLARSFKKKF